ncbi:hypothetical protein FRC02_000177 [Tulasnella sp. 418]|nr:hypothetical protein FRC02_000177 [Tulasnella sp. 418]
MKTESRKEPKHQTPSQMPRSQPPRQSARPKKVPVQRSRAARRLAEWMNMSVDVFAEICSHLFPIDPLHLSWGSKRLCSIPISKSARHIWHSARKGQLPTLPPCTDDLSEPRYIALLFTNICQVCGANRARLFHFTMRTRHSTSCYKTHAVTFKSLLWEGTLKDLGDHEAINLLAVVPENSALKAASSTRIHLKPALKNTGLSRVPSCEQNTSQPWGQKPRRLENTQKGI